MDKIIIKGGKYCGHIGICEEEKENAQLLLIGITLFFHKIIKKNDDIKDTINYSEVNKLIKEITNEKRYNLIETLAEEIAETIISRFCVDAIKIKVKKPCAVKNAEYAAVEIVRANG